MLLTPVEQDDDGNLLIDFNDLKSFLSPKLAICAQCRKCKLEIKINHIRVLHWTGSYMSTLYRY